MRKVLIFEGQETIMTIRPSAAIRQNYNEIAEFCKKSGEPVYLTKNGGGESSGNGYRCL